jgi:hypothetical protein
MISTIPFWIPFHKFLKTPLIKGLASTEYILIFIYMKKVTTIILMFVATTGFAQIDTTKVDYINILNIVLLI